MPDPKKDVIEVKGGRLIVDVALDKNPRRSRNGTGPNLVHFTTGGNKSINDEFVIGVNLYKRG